MTLTEKDLLAIKNIVEFSEMKLEGKIDDVDKKTDSLKGELREFREEMHREISDISENIRYTLKHIDSHETRIKKLELKTGLAK